MIEIHVTGKPTPAQRAAFKEAKSALKITEPMMFVEARPGCGRMIIFGAEQDERIPDFACRWLTLYRADASDVRDVLAWYLGSREDWRAGSLELWLEHALDRSGVHEVAPQ